MVARLALLALVSLVLVPACSAAPQCVIDNDCPVGQYCDNPPGGSGGVCIDRGTGEHDTGPRVDSGPHGDSGPATDAGPAGDTGPRMDTGPAADTGPASDGGAHDAAASGG
jgi:hypothetical protein